MKKSSLWQNEIMQLQCNVMFELELTNVRLLKQALSVSYSLEILSSKFCGHILKAGKNSRSVVVLQVSLPSV